MLDRSDYMTTTYRVCENGVYRDMTPEELEQMQKDALESQAREATRPLMASEVYEMLIKDKINDIEVDDKTAVRMKEFYPQWKDLCKKSYTAEKAGYKFKYGDQLYKTRQQNFTFQSQWIPGQGTSAIYTQIDYLHTGLIDDPIPVPADVTTNAFTYTIGLYYSWNGSLYLCQRTGDEPGKEYSFVYSPDQLIGNYFTIVEES